MLDAGRECIRSMFDGFLGIDGGGGRALKKAFRDGDPAKLFRLFGERGLFIGGGCRKISGGGGGKGSSWFDKLLSTSTVGIAGAGGGGRSGLGIRKFGFFGGRSGTHSSVRNTGGSPIGLDNCRCMYCC